MKKLSLILFVFMGLLACNSPKDKNVAGANVENYANSITAKELKTHLYTFASAEFEGRETGEPGQKKAAAYLKKQYEGGGIKSPLGDDDYYQDIPASYFNGRFKKTENVVAVIRGSEFPDQIVVVSAHYDHLGKDSFGRIYNGADDDGSGTVAVLEIAEAFKKAADDGFRPRRTILFLHCTGEEKGLLGSKYYTENPIFPLKNTVADLNTDMIGRIDNAHKNNPNYVYLIGSNRLSSELDTVVNHQNRKHTKLGLDYKYNAKGDPNHFYYRSDHYNFAKHNIPVIFFFNGAHKDYHKPTDTADKIQYGLLAKRAKLIFYTAWQVANRDDRLVVDKAK